MANKSIAKYIVGYINRKRYGITTGKLSPKPLVDTYTENSNCAVQISCDAPQPCDDDIVYKICNFSIGDLVKTDIDYYKIKFTIPSFHNGLIPYVTEWTYDTDIYELVEETASYITLNRIEDAEFVSVVSVKVTDKDGCFAYQEYDITFVPIEFIATLNCGSISYTGTFEAGEASTGNISVPYTIQGYGNIVIAIDTNVHGFSGSVASFPVTPGNGTSSFPLVYDGTEPSGVKTIPVKLTYGISTSSCNLNVTVAEPPAPVACTAAQNLVIENDSDDVPDIPTPTCDAITLVSGGTLPDAQEDVAYSHTMVFSGDTPFNAVHTTKPSWLNYAVVDNTLVFSGTPTTAETGLAVAIVVYNCELAYSHDIDQTIDVVPVVIVTGTLTHPADNTLTVILDSTIPCDVTFNVSGEPSFFEDIVVLASSISGNNTAIPVIPTCVYASGVTNINVSCSGTLYKITLSVFNSC